MKTHTYDRTRRSVGDSLPAPEQRLQELERSLEEQQRLLFDARLHLAKIHMSRGWKLLLRCYQLRNTVFPPGSRLRAYLDNATISALELAKKLTQRQCPSSISRRQYARWLVKHDPTSTQLSCQRHTSFPKQPLISVVVPTYNTPIRFLRAMVASVVSQTYPHWELCVADGSDMGSSCRELLKDYTRNPKIRVSFLPANKGIADNSNAALALATGDYIAFLDHDDLLAAHALHDIIKAINENPDSDLIYSDEDKITEDGSYRIHPDVKPDWSPDMLRSRNYICHLLVLRKDLLQRIGGFRSDFEGSQDYDLVLRATEKAACIVHVPRILYHWRSHSASTASNSNCKHYAYDAGRRALKEHLERTGKAGTVAAGPSAGVYDTRYCHASIPLVTAIIPSKDNVDLLRRCIASIQRHEASPVEIIIVENNSTRQETHAYYKHIICEERISVIEWPAKFNYSAINNYAATRARGDLLLFLNNDIEAQTEDWLTRLIEHALRPEVGAVGAKLSYPDGTIQHAGIVLGIRGVAGHAHRNYPGTSHGYGHRLIATHNVSAVTGACLMTRRAVFNEVGGFDDSFAMDFNDIDLCLKIRALNYQIVWTPYARLVHHESKTRGPKSTPAKRAIYDAERSHFEAKWASVIAQGDPFYNKNLTLENESFALTRK